MADIGHSLFIKYGLKQHPTQQQIDAWVSLVETLILAGIEKERAGDQAAAKIFPDYNTCVYASQADTIMTLLDAAKRK